METLKNLGYEVTVLKTPDNYYFVEATNKIKKKKYGATCKTVDEAILRVVNMLVK